MKLFDVYIERAGQKVLLRRFLAVSSDRVLPQMPQLAEGERYLAPQECKDLEAYREALADAKVRAESQEPGAHAGQSAVTSLQRRITRLQQK